MTIFWIMTAVVTALAGLWVLAGARRGMGASDGANETETDRLSGARELAELDRMKARGLMDEAGWTSARAEAGRRLLAAQRAQTQTRISAKDRFWVLAGLGLAVTLSLSLYLMFGRPGLPDQSYAKRVNEWAANSESLEPAQQAAVLGEIVRKNPENIMALSMLGASRFEAGDPIGAASALRRAVALDPANATNWARLGESLVTANNGQISGDAEMAFREALKLDENQLGARYFMGELAIERGEIAEAERHFGALIDAIPAQDPRRKALEDRLTQGREAAAKSQ